MTWTPQSFNEACKRAAGRRAYNKRRRLARERRITAILRLLDVQPGVSGRALAAVLRVHEATISRDLKFIRKVKAEYSRGNFGAQMHARSFRFIRGGGYETVFEIRHGVRLR
jgi:IS30 family transposase